MLLAEVHHPTLSGACAWTPVGRAARTPALISGTAANRNQRRLRRLCACIGGLPYDAGSVDDGDVTPKIGADHLRMRGDLRWRPPHHHRPQVEGDDLV